MKIYIKLFLACAMLIAISQAHADTLDTSIVKVGEDTSFKASYRIDTPTETAYFAVLVSSDLENWESQNFRYNPLTGLLTTPENSTLHITSTSAAGSGEISFDIDFAAGENLYTKLGPLDKRPAGERFLTQETYNLRANLHRIGWDPDQIIFGQEFPLSYSENSGAGNGNILQSDSKDVIGQHPGVHGVDFLYMIDRAWEEDFHKAAARKAYEDGAVITIDYHWHGKYGDSFNVDDIRDLALLDNVVNNDNSDGDVTWFYEKLDQIIEIINNDLQFPFVFRPLHENNGNWFWWGSRLQGGPETYKKAYQIIFDYMSERTDYLLFCWSPDKSLAQQYYPGDDYVDMIGMDVYGPGTVSWLSIPQMVNLVEQAVDFAEAHGKVAAITETGFASSSGNATYYDNNANWWMENHLNPILASAKARKVAWALTWINSSWSGPYIPHTGAPQAAIDDFQEYFDHEVTLFQDEVTALNVYDTPPSE